MNLYWRSFGLCEPQTEFRFTPERRWRFDYAWPEQRIALEVEGGVWTGGRHNRATGFLRDMEKYNAAAGMGWRVFRCQPRDLHKSWVYEMLRSAMVAGCRKKRGGAC